MIRDLTMPVTFDHFRWNAGRSESGDWSDDAPFRTTRLDLPCHAFTHVDARRHMLSDGEGIDETDVSDVYGPAFVADLSDVSSNDEIDADRVARALEGHDGEGILLLRTAWDTQRDWRAPSYWRDAPYISRSGAERLREADPRAIAFDFPQDYTIRLSLDGVVPPIGEHVTHDVLLRRGVTLIEYLMNTAAISERRVTLSALPLKVPGADGAPARVVAIEDQASIR